VECAPGSFVNNADRIQDNYRSSPHQFAKGYNKIKEFSNLPENETISRFSQDK
jgi:hypothetical protein